MTPTPLRDDELFFSTTDARGVIEKANAVFVRLSEHDWDELVGAPHNVIRHDDMPGGAFRLMWDALRAGHPFCAYVVNRAASGTPYEVFATITPLGSGYLSVRSKPCATALHDAALSLYGPARAAERDQRAAGASAAAAATVGAEHLVTALAAAGFASYEQFSLAALPAEVAARAALAGPLRRREGSGALVDLLDATCTVDEALAAWRDRMDRLAGLTASLRQGVADLGRVTEASGRTATRVVGSGQDGPLMLGVQVWASMLPEIDQALAGLAAELDELATSCARTRFRIALAQLHVEATAQFATELIDGTGTGSGTDAIRDLDRALREGVEQTVAQARQNAELAVASAASLDQVRDLLGVPQGLLAGWQELVARRSDGDVEALVPLMAAQLDEGERASATLAGLADACRAEAEPLDVTVLADALARIEQLAAAVADDRAPAPTRRAARVLDDEPAAPSRRALPDDEPAAAPRRGARFAD